MFKYHDGLIVIPANYGKQPFSFSTIVYDALMVLRNHTNHLSTYKLGYEERILIAIKAIVHFYSLDEYKDHSMKNTYDCYIVNDRIRALVDNHINRFMLNEMVCSQLLTIINEFRFGWTTNTYDLEMIHTITTYDEYVTRIIQRLNYWDEVFIAGVINKTYNSIQERTSPSSVYDTSIYETLTTKFEKHDIDRIINRRKLLGNHYGN